jgi:hypothetical protein
MDYVQNCDGYNFEVLPITSALTPTQSMSNSFQYSTAEMSDV